MDRIHIVGLRADTVIGVHDWEREIRQPVELDLDLAFDTRRAGATDRLEDTLDYAAISARLIELISASEFQLIEALADACAQVVLKEFPVASLRLVLRKPGAVPEADHVGVVIERDGTGE